MNVKQQKRKMIMEYALHLKSLKETITVKKHAGHLKNAYKTSEKFSLMFGQDIGRFYTLILKLKEGGVK